MRSVAVLLPLAAASVTLAKPVENEYIQSKPIVRRQGFGGFGGGATGGGGASGLLGQPGSGGALGGLGNLVSSLLPALTGNLGNSALVANIVQREKLQPQLRKDATRERIWFGPFTLPSADDPVRGPKTFLKMDPIGTEIDRLLSGFCTDCTVLYGKAGLYFEDGTKATVEQGVYEHHLVVVDLNKRTMPFYLCKGQSGFLGTLRASGFVISGNDEAPNWYTTPDGNFNSGYQIGKRGTMLVMQSELVNYKKEPQQVYVTIDYEWIPGVTDQPADSSVSLFSVTGCALPDYHRDINKKIYNMSSDAVPMPMDGFIINAKGHLHDGGSNIELTLNGRLVCDSKAVYGAGKAHAVDGQEWEVITEMTQCTQPIQVKKGDLLQMNSFYDTIKHPARPTNHKTEGGHMKDADEMGVYFINFAASNKTAEALKLSSAKKTLLLQQI